MGALGSLLLAFLTLGAPIGVALCAATVAFILYDPFLSENAIFRSFFSFVNKYTLMAIPFYLRGIPDGAYRPHQEAVSLR